MRKVRDVENSKFFVMVVLVLVVGGAIGGSFIGGLALGRSRDDPVPASSGGQLGLPEGLDLDQVRQQVAQGDLQIPDGVDLSEVRQQFLDGGGIREGGRPGGRAGGGNFTGGDDEVGGKFGGGLFGDGTPVAGTITEAGPNGFTVRAEDGTETEVTLGENGSIRRQKTLALGELEPGMQVLAIGPADESGIVVAGVVQVVE